MLLALVAVIVYAFVVKVVIDRWDTPVSPVRPSQRVPVVAAPVTPTPIPRWEAVPLIETTGACIYQVPGAGNIVRDKPDRWTTCEPWSVWRP